jgi:hypothetical protein
MSRPLRVEFSGALYHVMCRGNGLQQLFHDDGDYQRLLEDCAVPLGIVQLRDDAKPLPPVSADAATQPVARNAVSFIGLHQLVREAAPPPRTPLAEKVRYARPQVCVPTVQAVPLPIPPNTRVCDGNAHRPTPSSGRVAARRRGRDGLASIVQLNGAPQGQPARLNLTRRSRNQKAVHYQDGPRDHEEPFDSAVISAFTLCY